MSRRLAPGLYGWRDIRPGDVWETAGLTVTEAHVVGFAGLSGDFFELHMDDEAARALGYSARVAHGILVLALIDGLKNRAQARLDAVASLGWEQRFRAPVLIGDRISAELRVEEVRESGSQPGRGVVRLAITARNQRGETVQEGVNTLLMKG